jgi:hypothetical protein
MRFIKELSGMNFGTSDAETGIVWGALPTAQADFASNL